MVNRGPLDLDAHPGRVVADVSGEPQPTGQGVHVGPEAHALHDALDPEVQPNHLVHPVDSARPRGGAVRRRTIGRSSATTAPFEPSVGQ